MIGSRTRISFAQYLGLQPTTGLDLLFKKHGLTEIWERWRDFTSDQAKALAGCLEEVSAGQLQGLVEEVVATEPALYDGAVNRWGDGAGAYGARWQDLVRCLALDDYAIVRGQLTTIEPELQGASHVEDALVAEIRRSGLPSTEGIVTLLDQSAAAFRQVTPNFNACLSNTRAALQTMATEIALARQKAVGGASTFQPDKWGQVLVYLRTSGLITQVEEALVSAVYSFISAGAHRPVGLSEEEMARLGRGMSVSSCYFLVKLHNG